MMKKILVIDDEKGFGDLIKELLKPLGKYKVIFAKGGDRGMWFAHCHWHRPDLILLDIVMPGRDGLKLLQQLKKERKTFDIPVIIITGKTDPEYKDQAEALGCDGFMVKPVSLKDLRDKIQELLAKPPSSDTPEISLP